MNENRTNKEDNIKIIEHADGNKKWYLNGELHRVDGPAVEWADGTKQWFLNDKEYTKEAWFVEMMQGEKIK